MLLCSGDKDTKPADDKKTKPTDDAPKDDTTGKPKETPKKGELVPVRFTHARPALILSCCSHKLIKATKQLQYVRWSGLQAVSHTV